MRSLPTRVLDESWKPSCHHSTQCFAFAGKVSTSLSAQHQWHRFLSTEKTLKTLYFSKSQDCFVCTGLVPANSRERRTGPLLRMNWQKNNHIKRHNATQARKRSYWRKWHNFCVYICEKKSCSWAWFCDLLVFFQRKSLANIGGVLTSVEKKNKHFLVRRKVPKIPHSATKKRQGFPSMIFLGPASSPHLDSPPPPQKSWIYALEWLES